MSIFAVKCSIAAAQACQQLMSLCCSSMEAAQGTRQACEDLAALIEH